MKAKPLSIGSQVDEPSDAWDALFESIELKDLEDQADQRGWSVIEAAEEHAGGGQDAEG